jgi:predicted DNA-binding ribbon-helix-helix protein
MIRKHSLEIHGRQTCVMLEDADWRRFMWIAGVRGVTMTALVESLGPGSPRTRILELVKGNGVEVQAACDNHQLP